MQYRDSSNNATLNASYSPGCDIFGASNGMITRDIIAHEFTHAVVRNEIGVPYQNQQGALDESLADTLAAFSDGQLDDRRRLAARRDPHDEQPAGSTAIPIACPTS